MKNYQLLWRGRALALKASLLFLICIFFTSAYSQKTDVTGFNAAKEKEKAIKQGVHADELEGYIKNRKTYLKSQYDFKTKGIGKRNTKPPKVNTFIRKSSSSCVGDFENGTVSPWTGWTGNSNGISDIVNDITVYTSGVVSGRHTIMNTGNDPIVSSVSKVHSGSHSLRLGNSSTGAQTERVSRSVTVTSGCFSFWYALIFQNPNHPYNDQPFFMFRIKDSAGNLIDSFVREASNSSFFSNQGSIRYRDWTEYSVDLSSYLGQTVEIEFTTADCEWTGHYGYAYIDDVCFENCCETCEDLFNWPGTMATYPMVTKAGGTDSTCCFDFEWIFDADVFACDPYGIKVYKDGDPNTVYSSYFSDSGLVFEKNLQDPSVLDFCIDKSLLASSITIRVAFYAKDSTLICDTTKLELKPCCNTCDEVFRAPGIMANWDILKYAYSTETHCCYAFDWIFDADIFACDPYGIKIYEEGNESNPYVNYLGTTGMVYNGNPFDASLLDFCISKSDFNGQSKTIRVAILNAAGEVICDTMKKVLEPCHSSSSGCDCSNFFKHSSFAQTSIVSSDTSLGYEWQCCFRVNPYTDEDKFNCPYYGIRIYKDSSAYNSTYIDTLSPTPMGGPGNTYPDSLNYIFCLSNTLFNNGPITIRIEYLDSSGKVICSKTEEIECDESCCDNISYTVTKLSTDDIENCCYSILGHLGNCFQTQTVDLLRFDGQNWSVVATQQVPGGVFFFDSLCQPLGDTAKYVVNVIDTLGNIICSKEIETYCIDCCKNISAFMTPAPPPPPGPIFLDRCCWDFYYYPQSTIGCPIVDKWFLFCEDDTVPQQWPLFYIPMGDSMGRYCTDVIQAVYPAPGTSVTVWYKLKKQLALYDTSGNLICIKVLEDSCARVYTNPFSGGGLNLTVNPNPFTGSFTASMELPTAMAIEVKIINGSGLVVYENNYGEQPQGEFSTQINLSGQPTGTYTISINNGQATAQIVKQ
ncbi:MAG: T9SS type A sorting domain-containing protein [bacterium]